MKSVHNMKHLSSEISSDQKIRKQESQGFIF